VTTFLVLDDKQIEILGFGLNPALRTQRQAMAEIMRDRLERAADGEKEPAKWKESRFNSLLFRVLRLESLVWRLDSVPGDRKPLELSSPRFRQ